MKRILFIPLAAVLLGAAAPSFDYLYTMIRCSPEEERHIDDLYQRYVSLVGSRSLAKGTKLHLPKKCASTHGEYVIFSWSYYVTPNNLRGFVISIPKKHLTLAGGHHVTSTHLTIEQEYFKQGHHLIVLKESPEPALPVERVRPAASRPPAPAN